MRQSPVSEPAPWKSARCEASACVEVTRDTYDTVLVRSSKWPEHIIVFDTDEWAAFLAGVKNGDFDL